MGGTLHVPWAQVQKVKRPLLGFPAGHAHCPWTMPLCRRPKPSARAWTCISSCFLPVSSAHSLGSASMTVSVKAWHALEPTGCMALPAVSLSSLQTVEGLFIPVAPLSSSQAFSCAVSPSWNASFPGLATLSRAAEQGKSLEFD